MLIDNLSYQSRLRYTNTGEKFLLAAAALIFCVAGRSVRLGLFVFFSMSLFTVAAGRIPLRFYLRLLKVPLLFLAANAAILGTVIGNFPLELFAFPVGKFYLTASRETALYGFRIFITALGAVSCLYFLSLNIPVTDLITFFRRLHCPALIAELMLLIYRFIFVLSDCAGSVSVSQQSRLGNINFRTSLHSFGALASCLFIRSIRRAEALFDAMESRCYDGEIRVLSEHRPARLSETAAIAAYIAFLVFLVQS